MIRQRPAESNFPFAVRPTREPSPGCGGKIGGLGSDPISKYRGSKAKRATYKSALSSGSASQQTGVDGSDVETAMSALPGPGDEQILSANCNPRRSSPPPFSSATDATRKSASPMRISAQIESPRCINIVPRQSHLLLSVVTCAPRAPRLDQTARRPALPFRRFITSADARRLDFAGIICSPDFWELLHAAR